MLADVKLEIQHAHISLRHGIIRTSHIVHKDQGRGPGLPRSVEATRHLRETVLAPALWNWMIVREEAQYLILWCARRAGRAGSIRSMPRTGLDSDVRQLTAACCMGSTHRSRHSNIPAPRCDATLLQLLRLSLGPQTPYSPTLWPRLSTNPVASMEPNVIFVIEAC